MKTQTALRFSFEDVAPLDWFQWRCLLWDHMPGESRGDWEAIAERVNGVCADSEPRAAGEYRSAFAAVRAAYPGEMPGIELWTRSLYEQVPALAGQQPPFMNLGYADGDVALSEAEEPFRLQIQLYERALAGDRLKGKRLVEVGCGGGGGASYLARAHGPASITGTDLLERNVRHCRTAYSQEELFFEQAEAACLPFGSQTVDAVVNVESSGHYPSLEGFLEEVRRILRPPGRLYLADLRATDGMWGRKRDLSDLRRAIHSAGLRVVKEDSLSAGVLRSIDLQEEGRRAFLRYAIEDRHVLSHFEEIMLMRGSRNHARLESGKLEYCLFVCERKGAR